MSVFNEVAQLFYRGWCRLPFSTRGGMGVVFGGMLALFLALIVSTINHLLDGQPTSLRELHIWGMPWYTLLVFFGVATVSAQLHELKMLFTEAGVIKDPAKEKSG